MTLEEFKRIYYMEHYHRVYGRVLGLTIIGPSAFFIWRGWVSGKTKRFLMASSALVAFQVNQQPSWELLNMVGAVGLVYG